MALEIVDMIERIILVKYSFVFLCVWLGIFRLWCSSVNKASGVVRPVRSARPGVLI